ncbi:metal-dependent hydrolase [Pseudoxanthomonas sp. 10H]|uniref:metal-dependent hydrolase n=1 Tax=Pseudoxanthomonas sp. 10H TaxID=3242729 RepID=UPI003555FD86
MPFTPLHLGAGAVFKAVAGRRMSFLVFAGTQVLMDLEPLVGILRGSAVLHGPTHTLAGAVLIGGVGAVTGKPVTNAVLRRVSPASVPVGWPAAFAGAWAGSLSHIVLDAFMHADMRPFWPLTSANPLLYRIDVDHLGLLCLLGATAGGAAVLLRRTWRRRGAARATGD